MFAAQAMSEGLESLSRNQLEPVGCPAGVEAFRPGNPLSAYISWDPVDLLPSVSRCNRTVGGTGAGPGVLQKALEAEKIYDSLPMTLNRSHGGV